MFSVNSNSKTGTEMPSSMTARIRCTEPSKSAMSSAGHCPAGKLSAWNAALRHVATSMRLRVRSPGSGVAKTPAQCEASSQSPYGDSGKGGDDAGTAAACRVGNGRYPQFKKDRILPSIRASSSRLVDPLLLPTLADHTSQTAGRPD